MHSGRNQVAARPALLVRTYPPGTVQSRAAGSPGVPFFEVNWLLLRHFAFSALATLPCPAPGGLRSHCSVPGHRPAHGGFRPRLRHLWRGVVPR